MRYQITYAGINKVVEAADDLDSLLDISIRNQLPHLHECGGHGRCTTCRVRVLDGIQNLTPKSPLEKEASFLRKWDPSIRLACQTYPKGDVVLQRLIWSMAEVTSLQKELAPEGKAEERPITILFCDLRNFTPLSSKSMNFDLAYMLNRFYTAMGEPILMNNGIIYQYVGDEIIGVFGTTGGTREKNCTDAIRAALGMQYALAHLNQVELKDLDMELQSGIGINFGKAYVGHLGHPTHRQFSVIGDPVNVASRIQGKTKETGTKILISESVLNSLPENVLDTGQSFELELTGKEGLARLTEVRGFREMDTQLELQSSLHLMLDDQDKFASLFYDKVFSISPETRSLFKRNMTDQGRLLTHMLSGIVYTLARPDHLVEGIRALGRNHQAYGVTSAHYPVVRKAMLETIDQVLGNNKTQNTMTAWTESLDFILKEMQQSQS
ncbi:adenylate/guanylate cyclase domain-containing protein [Robertkochia flava]|uniref:adenylate/guanylate cyclase domain-containing protein n=1 Tax=Robertkochia flava TaxID=3447986 RepID=UPI001CCCA2AA|nr:adenylate/guanylate cyclase domain-containing protein [Robertkochia marina]